MKNEKSENNEININFVFIFYYAIANKIRKRKIY